MIDPLSAKENKLPAECFPATACELVLFPAAKAEVCPSNFIFCGEMTFFCETKSVRRKNEI
jgi:hypothetical protein